MIRRRLYRWTGIVVGIYVVALLIGVSLRIAFPDNSSEHANPVYSTYKDMMPFLIAIPAAWLGYCFQRRMSYLSALRGFWGDLIPAVQQAIQYTYLETPSGERFATTTKDLSIVIDSLRGVFKNIPSGDPVGLYPYENLKDIWKVISWLGHSNNRSDHDRYWARRYIRLLWASMHQAMLQEFDREVPSFPLGRYIDGRPTMQEKLEKGALTDKDFEDEEEWQRRRLTKRCS